MGNTIVRFSTEWVKQNTSHHWCQQLHPPTEFVTDLTHFHFKSIVVTFQDLCDFILVDFRYLAPEHVNQSQNIIEEDSQLHQRI